MGEAKRKRDRAAMFNKWYITMPGLQMMVESTKDFEEMCADILKQAKEGLIVLEPKPNIRSVVMVSTFQHFQFNIMSEQEWNRMAAEQKYAVMQQGRH